MQIEARGEPPYKVSSGPTSRKIGREQFCGAQVFSEAFGMIFDLSDGGLIPTSAYVRDSLENIVFTVDNPDDLQLLREADEAGLTNIEFVE